MKLVMTSYSRGEMAGGFGDLEMSGGFGETSYGQL